MIIKPFLPIQWIAVAAALLLTFAIFCIVKKSLRHTHIFRRIAIVTLILAALLRPMAGIESEKRIVSDLNLFFIVDNTGSMATKDMENGERYRYEAVKSDIKKIVNMYQGARYSITIVDYDIYQSLPLTNNASMAIAAANAIRPRKSNATVSTDLEDLLDFATNRIAKYNKRNPDRRSVIFLMTDGEESNEQKTRVPKELKAELSGGIVIGYGTTTGDKVHRISNENQILENEFIRESTLSDEYHISKLDENNLKAIADSLSARYIRRDDTGELPKDLENYFLSHTRSTGATEGKMDLYWIIAIAVIGLCLWDAASIAHKLALERKAVK